ncbi:MULTISPECIES: SURF1 family protein [Halocynthiibacter]|uniref:SURF1-like protein n=1 Tax=Halocynthiibacter halioticoli TaxID=2986804 RepID=A0AAE3J016_9RHOB|nr:MULTISPECIES: SURF1 family protein [Halocynthiibacter]MCV6825250.1 SURF1 family protein [Halocynthiibacter halioticoli]MCW4058251.1 SURF1 family protein [Halocynthiibacter sp. SDUM655004]
MNRKYILPLIFGIVGTLILCSLGFWQLDRLDEKTEELAKIDATILADPVSVPEVPNEDRDQYLPVKAAGTVGPREITVLASVQKIGAGYRIISEFTLENGRRILLDRGFVAIPAKDAPRPVVAAEITGNLLWPDEMQSSTPPPDLDAGVWFGRDIPAMAKALDTEPVLLVQRSSTEPNLVTTPFPVDSSGIPNRHLEYVLTWFGLAIVWFGMTAFFLWRIRQRTV